MRCCVKYSSADRKKERQVQRIIMALIDVGSPLTVKPPVLHLKTYVFVSPVTHSNDLAEVCFCCLACHLNYVLTYMYSKSSNNARFMPFGWCYKWNGINPAQLEDPGIYSIEYNNV